MLLSFARRSVRILSQVRPLRCQPSPSVTRFTNKKGEEIIIGETVVEKFGRFPQPQDKKGILSDPSVLTPVHKPPEEIDKDVAAKHAYTPDDLALFESIEEIKVDDALRNYKEGQFDANFLDTLGPGLMPTYNVAALADKVEVIQRLAMLNVTMTKWDEKPEIFSKMIKLNWKADCEAKLELLVAKIGFDKDNLSRVLTRNPLLLTEDLQHLEARYEYLLDKEQGLGLLKKNALRVTSTEAYWLSTPIEAIENRIRFFQSQYALEKKEFQKIVVARPQILLTQLRNLALKKFSLIEEIGFSQEEIRQAILNAPKILTTSRHALVERFQIMNLEMGLSHNKIAAAASALYCRGSRLRERHEFLKHLKRDQYDNTKPGYISLKAIISGTHEFFVKNVAKSSMEEFENFVKSR